MFPNGNYTIIGLDNGLSAVVYQDIVWTKHGLLLFNPSKYASMKLESKYINYHTENVYGNVECKMAAIFIRVQCLKSKFYASNRGKKQHHFTTFSSRNTINNFGAACVYFMHRWRVLNSCVALDTNERRKSRWLCL